VVFVGAHSGRHFLKGMIVSAAIVGLDQYTKWLVVENMLLQTSTPKDFETWFLTRQTINSLMDFDALYKSIVVSPYMNLTMVWNKGVSFGLLDHLGSSGPIILSAVALMISMLMVVWMAIAPRFLSAMGLALIIGGAIGNVIDRVRFGAVADFVDVHYAGFHWPAFNLADSCIVLGAFLLILDILLTPKQPAQEPLVAEHTET
jgi:signal peptidase II